MKLITLLYVVPRSRMRGTVPSLFEYALIAWCLVKAQGQLYLHLYDISVILLLRIQYLSKYF
jgi:hypothetical protein